MKINKGIPNMLQASLDAGAKRVLIPASNAPDLATVSDLLSKFQISFYSDSEDALRKALGKL